MEYLKNIRNRKSPPKTNVDLALKMLAELIELANELKSTRLARKAIRWVAEIECLTLSPFQSCVLNYYCSNAYGDIYNHLFSKTQKSWRWKQTELSKQIYYLRRSINNPEFENFSWVLRCQALTNLGNCMNTLGRFIEAQGYYTKALEINQNFWMARGNRGLGRNDYCRCLFDFGQQEIFATKSYNDLLLACIDFGNFSDLGSNEALETFVRSYENISSIFNIEQITERYNPTLHHMGRSKSEIKYRTWVLQNILFLNPLNDIENNAISAHDILSLPPHTTEFTSPPNLIGFFNLMKQEYSSARFLFYEGSTSLKPHFSDKNVATLDTLDYSSFGLAVEKIKASYRISFSIFDKIAFFLNQYFNLKISEKKVNFRTIWFESEDYTRPVKKIFENTKNWPLRGLFWLARDFAKIDENDALEPDAKIISEIRNTIEHKYLKVVNYLEVNEDVFKNTNTFVYEISRQSLSAKALRVLKNSRSALIYLSLGMHWEEKERKKRMKKKISIPITLPLYKDNFKI